MTSETTDKATEWRAEPDPDWPQNDNGWRVIDCKTGAILVYRVTEPIAKLIAASPDMLEALKLWASDKYDDAANAPKATVEALKKAGKL